MGGWNGWSWRWGRELESYCQNSNCSLSIFFHLLFHFCSFVTLKSFIQPITGNFSFFYFSLSLSFFWYFGL